MRLQRIVIGVDFSETSTAAVRWVADHLAPDAELVLLHSVFVPQPPRFLRGRFPHPQRLIESARAGAEARLAEVARGSARAHRAVRLGRPAEQIVRCAEEMRSDLIVVGKHDERPGLWDWLGSTAEQVLLNSTVPVLLATEVRDDAPRKLLMALDEGDVASWVLLWTRTLSERFDAQVVALHVVRSVSPSSALAMASAANAGISGMALDPELLVPPLQQHAQRWRTRILEAGVDPARLTNEIAVGEPEYEIIRAAESSGSDLIIMGNRRPAKLARSMLGSVVRGVLRHASCPTLVVSEPRDRAAC